MVCWPQPARRFARGRTGASYARRAVRPVAPRAGMTKTASMLTIVAGRLQLPEAVGRMVISVVSTLDGASITCRTARAMSAGWRAIAR